MTQEWYPSISDWSIINEEKARFLLNETKVYFDCLVKTNEISNTKAMILFGILITLTTGIIGFLVTSFNSAATHPTVPTVIFAWSVTLCFGYALYRTMITLIMPQKMPAPGNEPECLLTNELMQHSIETILTAQVITSQRQISRLVEVNARIANEIAISLKIAAAAPFIGIATVFVYLSLSLLE